RAEGLEVKIVAVLDISMGADVVIVRPDIKSLNDLKGKKIGVEQSAVGAVMLNALLEKSYLSLADINIVYLTVNQHLQAYMDNKVDALVTFEPVRTQLIKAGARQIFDSSQIPGRIIDVLAVLPHVLNKSPRNLKKIIQGHFKAREFYLTNKNEAAVFLSKRLQLKPEEVASSYEGLLLPDLKENHYWMGGEHSRLEKTADDLKKIMDRAKLLKNDVSVKNLVSDAYL
ncbi:MAG: ABC transporter substrate-binding protein, partial [Gammaproteobacteria bacterium]|nr:ABC transporter substrate-binding protein [Gammaproteobacteria bacterium]